MLNVTKGMLVEYGLLLPPTVLVFDFNPTSITWTRTITVPKRTKEVTYDFQSPSETTKVARGVVVQPETLTFTILLDATDRMDEGKAIATEFGIQPELDTLRTMLEPKTQGPGGVLTLSSLGHGGVRPLKSDDSASVLLFVWGQHLLPVFLTSVKIDENEYLPSLVPYRAKATLTLQVIESANPFYLVEQVRQAMGAGLNTRRTVAAAIGGLF